MRGYWCGESGVYRWQMAHHFQFLAVPQIYLGIAEMTMGKVRAIIQTLVDTCYFS